MRPGGGAAAGAGASGGGIWGKMKGRGLRSFILPKISPPEASDLRSGWANREGGVAGLSGRGR